MSAPSDLCTHARKGRLFALTYEVHGGVHFGPLFNKDGIRERKDAEKKGRIEGVGWEVLIVTNDDLRRDALPATREFVRQFLGEER